MEDPRNGEGIANLVMAVGTAPERQNDDCRLDRAAVDLPKITLYRVLSDHFHWKKELAEVLIGRCRKPADKFGNPDDCGLGKWCNSIRKSGYGDSPEFAKLRDPHDRVHLHAERAVIHLRNGNRIGALAEFDRVEAASQEVIAVLQKMIDTADL